MPYNILLVDDDAEFREEFGECLEDYRVIPAADGREALEILRRPNEIDLVLLDVKMPGPDGTQILPLIKEMSPDLPVVILTAYSTKDTAIKALKGNADDYLEKPIDIDRTERIIRELILARGALDETFADDAEGRIERVKSFLGRNYHKKVSLEDAAELVCLSPKYLSRLFREKTGSGFSEYRLSLKIDKAKELLEESGATINQISYDLGYRNMESFIRIFKKFTGLTPTEYRRRR